jgi:hypothetical protein
MEKSDSAHSNNARSASNMITCFPTNNSTDVHHCDIVSSRSSPSHFTKDTPLKKQNIYIVCFKTLILNQLLILPKSEPGQLQKN